MPVPIDGGRGYVSVSLVLAARSQGVNRKQVMRDPLFIFVPLVSCFWHQKRKGDTSDFVEGVKGVINVAAKEKNVYNTDASKDKVDRWKK